MSIHLKPYFIMKKRIVLLFALITLTMGAMAQTFQQNGIAYSVTINAQPLTVEVVSNAAEYFGIVEIPFEVPFNGEIYTVTRIADGAFQYCNSVTTVIIPYSVTSIGDYAFADCSGLNSITLPNSMQYIGQNAFQGCTGLTSIVIPNNVMQIGYGAFSDCTSLTSLIVQEGNVYYTSVNNVLYNQNLTVLICCPAGLTGNFIVLNTVTRISPQAFANCSGLTSVTIPGNVTYIGNMAFYDCYGLTSVTLDYGITHIGGSAFQGCTALTNVTLPNSVVYLGASAFRGCTSLTNINLGNAVTRIGAGAFQKCSSLATLTIPASVVRIGGRAFKDCSGLNSITFLPQMPPEIFYDTFESDQRGMPVYVPAGSEIGRASCRERVLRLV